MRKKIDVLALDGVFANGGAEGLVRDTKHDDDVLVLGLGDELRDDADVVQRPFSVVDTHGAVEHVNGAKAPGVVPAILGSRKRMEVKVDTETILACPGDGL